MNKDKGKRTSIKVEELMEEPKVPIVLNGNSCFVFPDGSEYEGDWLETDGVKVREGYGTFRIGPEEYVGSWSNDLMHGKGCYKFASGATYEGDFQKNVFEGYGVYKFADGAVYSGGWLAGKMHGEGEYKTNVDCWKGLFFNGMFDSGRSYISLRP